MKKIFNASILSTLALTMMLVMGCQKEDDFFPDASIPLTLKNGTLTGTSMGEPVHFRSVQVRARPANSNGDWVWKSHTIPEIQYNESVELTIDKAIGYCDIEVEIGYYPADYKDPPVASVSVATGEIVELSPTILNITGQLCVENLPLTLNALHGYKP